MKRICVYLYLHQHYLLYVPAVCLFCFHCFIDLANIDCFQERNECQFDPYVVELFVPVFHSFGIDNAIFSTKRRRHLDLNDLTKVSTTHKLYPFQ